MSDYIDNGNEISDGNNTDNCIKSAARIRHLGGVGHIIQATVVLLAGVGLIIWGIAANGDEQPLFFSVDSLGSILVLCGLLVLVLGIAAVSASALYVWHKTKGLITEVTTYERPELTIKEERLDTGERNTDAVNEYAVSIWICPDCKSVNRSYIGSCKCGYTKRTDTVIYRS